MKKLLLLTAMLATSVWLLAQGNTWQTATLISSGATKTGTLDNNNTEDWYKINVTTEGSVKLVVTPSGNLTLSGSSAISGINNNSLNTRAYFTAQSSGSSTLACEVVDAGKGTYYIRLLRSGGNGGYTLKYTFTQCPLSNDPEENDVYEHASLLETGVVQGRLGYKTSEGVVDNYDWYKIVVPEEGQVELSMTPTANLTFSGNSSISGLSNNSLYTRAYFFPDTTGSTTYTCKVIDVGKGTYYVRILRSGGNGGYTLRYTFRSCSLSADPEPNDDYQHASLLQPGVVQGRLGYRTSEGVTDTDDWYKIVVPEEGQVELTVIPNGNLTFSGSSNINGFANNGLYNRAYFTPKSSGSTTYTCKVTDAGTGTYYIRICRSGGSDGYTLTYTFTPCPLRNDLEPNDEYEHASWLKSGRTQQGRLGYRTSDGVTDIYDWYKITVTKAGPVEIIITPTDNLTFSTSSNVNVVNGNSLSNVGYFSPKASGSTTLIFQKNELAAGTYYVRVYRYGGNSGYRVRYNGPTITGDVDGDGRLSIGDVTDIIGYLLGGNNPSFAIGDSDLDGDGRINIGDVTDLIELLLSPDEVIN